MQYLDDGKSEVAVPASELRLAAEQDRAPPSKPHGFKLSLNLSSGISDPVEYTVRTPRAIVHDCTSKSAPVDSTVFVVEGQQESLAMGTGVRGIRFLRSSMRA